MDITTLVHDARNGDRDAVGALYDLHLDAVYRFVFFRVGSREDAEDITETVFISAFTHIGDYTDNGSPFAAWLYKIARNKIIDHYRSHKQKVPLEAVAEMPGEENVEQTVENKLTKEYIMSCVQTLPATYQEIVILKYIEDKTNEEISELLDKPIAHVRVLQSRAIQKLREIVHHE